LWVQRPDRVDDPGVFDVLDYDKLRDFNEPMQWDHFDSDGACVASVRVPARFQPYVVTGTSLLGVIRDENDVEYVVRYSTSNVASKN
jgi:hypothetical protein